MVLSQTIFLECCEMELYFSLGFGITSCLLLAVMGYDCYVDIYNILHYSAIMNWMVCAILVFSVCAMRFLLSLV